MKMKLRFSQRATVAAALALLSLAVNGCGRQLRTTSNAERTDHATRGSAPRTPWGEPDLQGIWFRDVDIPLQRPAKYANQEFFTDDERAELDRRISDIVGRDTTESRRARGTEADVNDEFSQAPYTARLPVGKRTSLIVDPPDGRIPALTPEAQQTKNMMRQFQLALLQPTEACKKRQRGCAGGTYGPVSARRNETPPTYVIGGIIDGINRANDPEERGLNERCLAGGFSDFSSVVGGGFRRIVQSPGQVAMFFDGGPGWPRNIPITTAPHLPQTIRQWRGDSRGRWEGDTLVVDVTNFSPKSDFQGAHENLHLVERWTRLDAETIDYVITIEDPTMWTKPWTVKQELKKQSDAANRIYYEPRCHEGNYGLVGVLAGARAVEKAFKEGRGPDPATLCSSFAGCGAFDFGFAPEGDDANPLR
jgi:hypothetical protein